MCFLQRVVSIILLSNIIDDVDYFLTHPTISICVENVLNFTTIKRKGDIVHCGGTLFTSE